MFLLFPYIPSYSFIKKGKRIKVVKNATSIRNVKLFFHFKFSSSVATPDAINITCSIYKVIGHVLCCNIWFCSGECPG